MMWYGDYNGLLYALRIAKAITYEQYTKLFTMYHSPDKEIRSLATQMMEELAQKQKEREYGKEQKVPETQEGG